MALSDDIDALAADAIRRRIFPGAVVLITADDQIAHAAAYGSTMYDAPESRPAALDTIYDIASLTKMFTATAALQLVDAGRLELRAPVAHYLPGFRAADITVFHLLTHSSGLDIRLSALRHAGRAALLEAVYRALPAHPPGSRVAYTNVNSLLLGEIVARLAGVALDQALRARLTEPLGLRDTCFHPPAALRSRVAPTELDDGWRGGLIHGSVHDESAHALGGVAGHAGLFSTAADLHIFCRSWLPAPEGLAACGGALRPETIALAQTNHTGALNLGCGLGWMIDRPNFMGAAPVGTIGHTGFTGPALVIVPPQRLIIVVLCNRVYPRRGPPDHHAVIAAIVQAALAHRPGASQSRQPALRQTIA